MMSLIIGLPGSTKPLLRSIELHSVELILNSSPGLILNSCPAVLICNIPLTFVKILGIISVPFDIKLLFLAFNFSNNVGLSI